MTEAASPADARRQAAFGHAALDPRSAEPEGLAAPDGGPAGRRFDVYRNNVVAGLVEALGAAYPAVKTLVGDAFFDAAAGVFVRARPPKTPMMILYGDGFADWLAAFEPAATLPYLPDVARIERDRLEALHAADAASLTPEQVGAAVAGRDEAAVLRLHLHPHPSARATRSAHPAGSIWRRASAQTADRTRLAPGPEAALTVRGADDVVRTHVCAVGVSCTLDALRGGADVAQAIEAAGGRDAFTAALGVLSSLGAIVSVLETRGRH